MQIFYSNIKADGDLAVTPSERREMRNAIIDYGALQPDPVRQPDTESTDEQVSNEWTTFERPRLTMASERNRW